MADELFVPTPEQLASGLTLGVHRLRPGLWYDGVNVLFEPQGVVSMKGRATVGTAFTTFDQHAGNFDAAPGLFDSAGGESDLTSIGSNDPIIGLHQLKTNAGVRQLFIGTGSVIKLYAGSVVLTKGSGYSSYGVEAIGRPATYWSMTSWGDWVIATNNRDAPQLYKGSGIFNPLTASDAAAPSLAKIAFQFGPHVLLANTNNGRNLIEFCAEGDPEAWNTTTNPTAGSLPLRQLETDIISCVPLGQNYAVYTNNEMQVLAYLGGVFSFGAIPALTGVGAISQNSVQAVGSRNFGLMLDGIFVTDGTAFQMVSDRNFGQWVRRNINQSQMSKVVSYHDISRRQVRWAIPTGTSQAVDTVISINYNTGAITRSSLLFTFGLEPGILPSPIIGSFNGVIAAEDSGNSDFGSAITRTLQTKPLDLGKRANWKTVDFVQSEISVISGSAPSLYVGVQEAITDTITWSGPFATASDIDLEPVGVSGVYVSLKWESSGSNDDWELGGFRIFGTVDGEAF